MIEMSNNGMRIRRYPRASNRTRMPQSKRRCTSRSRMAQGLREMPESKSRIGGTSPEMRIVESLEIAKTDRRQCSSSICERLDGRLKVTDGSEEQWRQAAGGRRETMAAASKTMLQRPEQSGEHESERTATGQEMRVEDRAVHGAAVSPCFLMSQTAGSNGPVSSGFRRWRLRWRSLSEERRVAHSWPWPF
jgi:hypothetical protein